MNDKAKIKVLCIEDEQEIRENICEILRDEGFEVFETGNGKEALNIFLEEPLDVIISDIMMPEISGYDLLKMIREDKSTHNNNIPFIFLTALAQKEDMVKGIGVGANDYLVKPVDFDLLIAKIKEKAKNARTIKEKQNRTIDNIKTQVSSIIPSELTKYIDVISQVSEFLKSEPYGPFPHKKYLQDINKIYINSIKLKTVINNFLDGNVVANQININEEIVDPIDLIEKLIAHLDRKFAAKIKLDYDNEILLPKIRIDKMIISEAIGKIFSLLFQIDPDGKIVISAIVNHTNQLVFIFYYKTKLEEEVLRKKLDKISIDKLLAKQDCDFELDFKDNEVNILIYIPEHRVEEIKHIAFC